MVDEPSPLPRWLSWLPPALAVTAFAAGIGNELIYDDNPLLRERLAPDTPFLSLWTTDYWANGSGLYRPLTLSFLWVQRQVFGLVPEGFHLVSVALHALATWLFSRTASRLVPAPIALAAACLFAVHPLHAEAVLPVYGQADLLAGVFVLATTDRITAPLSRANITLAVLLAALATLSKETGLLAFPLGWLTLAWVTRSAARPALAIAASWLLYLPLRIAVIGTAVVGSDAAFTSGFESTTRLKLVVVSLAESVRLNVVPWRQTPNYAHLREVLAGPVWVEAAIICLAALACWGLRRGAPRWAIPAAALWFLVSVGPVLNIVPIGTLVPERSLYLAVGGTALVLGTAIASLARPWVRIAALAILSATGVALCARLAHRWHDEVSLWQSVTADHPRSPQGHSFLGSAYLLELELADPTEEQRRNSLLRSAKREFSRALQLNSQSASALRGLGISALLEGDALAATGYLSKSNQLRPGDAQTQRFLGQARAQLRQSREEN